LLAAGNRPVSAIIFTHSHIDHFGGVFGVISPQEVAERKIPVIAPDGFMEEATSENVMVGTAMGRRSSCPFGKDLERSARGMVDTGPGKAVAYGHCGILPPNRVIGQPKEKK
jgi:alkyl sulfatase BDS1-like metallo-beta-lactamase superfamily hydrolase